MRINSDQLKVPVTLTAGQVSFLVECLDKLRKDNNTSPKSGTYDERNKIDREYFDLIQYLVKAKGASEMREEMKACTEGAVPISRAQAQAKADAFNSEWREEAREYIMARLYQHIRERAEEGWQYCGIFNIVAECLGRYNIRIETGRLRDVTKMLNLKDSVVKLGYDWEETEGMDPSISWAAKEAV